MSQYAMRRLYARLYRQPRTLPAQQAIRLLQCLRRDDRQRAHGRHQQWPRLPRQRVDRNKYRLPLGAPGRILLL